MVDCQGEFSCHGFSTNSQPTKSDNTSIVSRNSIVNCVINVNPQYNIHISVPEGKDRGVNGQEDNVVREESVVGPRVARDKERDVREASVVCHRVAGEEEPDVRKESVIGPRMAGEEQRDVREESVIGARVARSEEHEDRETSVIDRHVAGVEESDVQKASAVNPRVPGEEEGRTDTEGLRLVQGYEKTSDQDSHSDHYSMTSSQESADLQKVMCSYSKGSPMPKPENCLLMQTSTLKASKYKLIRYFEEKVLQSYCKVVLTDDFVLCVSSGSEDVISLTVDLRRDDYKFKEDTHILCLPNRKQLHFNHNTGSLLREKIAQVKSHTVPLPQKSKVASENSMRRAYSVPSKPTHATKRKSSKDAVDMDCGKFEPVTSQDCSSVKLLPGTGEVTEDVLRVISQRPSLRGKVAIIGHHLGLTPEELQTCKSNADDRTKQSELFLVLQIWMTKQEDAKSSMVTLQHVLDHCRDSETVNNSLTPANQ